MEWFETARESSDSLHEAAEVALERVIESGFSDQLLRAMGAEILVYYWRKEQSSQRRDTLEPGRRRFNTKSLQNEDTLMDALVHVEGTTWIPFGDLTRKDCQLISKAYQKREISNRKWRLFYEKIEQNLEQGEQHIRDKFTVAQLRSMFAEHELDPSELA